MAVNRYQTQIVAVAGAGAACTVACALYMARPAEGAGELSVTFFLFVTWALLPYLFLLRWARRPAATELVAGLQLAAALLVALGGGALLVQTAFITPDAQGGLVILFLPVYQWLALAAVAAIAWLLSNR